mgnify:CR=1 FL=1
MRTSIFDLDRVKEILDTLSRNKSRTLLTGFGIFWGMFMLLTMSGGGAGLKALLQRNFAGFATNSVIMAPNVTSKPYKGFMRGRRWSMHLDDVEYLRQAVPEAEVISPVISFWSRDAVYSDKSFTAILKGNTADYALIETPEMKYGRFISEMDIIQKRKVCVIGNRVWQTLFGRGVNPCGKFIRVGGTWLEVIGVNVSESNMSINGPAEESIVVPIDVLQMIYHTGSEVELVAMTARPGVPASDIQERARQALYRKYYVAPDDKTAMFVVNAEKMYSIVDNLYRGLNILVWLVGLGTLLAGAIGVSNIMMVTVRERTTEIGIRRAIGATPRMILGQIMTESIVLTAVSGALGIMFSVLMLSGADIVVKAAGTSGVTFQVGFGTAMTAMGILAVLGLLAGLAPAYRAMSIRPVDAMRDE